MKEARTENLSQPLTPENFPRDFPAQQQSPPGLQMNMTPLPDCGEDSYIGTGQLKGKKALITGGDSGIGRATAIAFAREGADVSLAFTEAERPDAQEVQRYIEDAGQKAVLLPGNLLDEAYARDMVDSAAKAMGGLDILVLNAARQVHVDGILDMSMDVVREVFGVNIISMYPTVQQAMQYLNSGASIITTTSVQAYEPNPALLDYAPTKAAIVQFSRALSLQLAPRGIRVNSVAPGPVWTPLQVSGGQAAKDIPRFGQWAPLGRAGQPVECAPVYVFLASDRASYVTGQVYGVTGGILTG